MHRSDILAVAVHLYAVVHQSCTLWPVLLLQEFESEERRVVGEIEIQLEVRPEVAKGVTAPLLHLPFALCLSSGSQSAVMQVI